jgi:two-component system, cell cycle sensor histidine kinase and response regulator CckA
VTKKPTYEELEKRIKELEQEVTKRKQAEEDPRESEERFRLAFENANDGVCLVDTDGNLVIVNNRMCEIFGYSKKELESMTVNDIALPEDRDISPKFIKKSIAGEDENSVFEKRYFHKQGHIIWGQISSSIIRDEKGDPLCFISHVQDISQRKHAEKALRESEVELLSVFRAAPIGIGVVIDRIFTKVNARLCEMTGYSEKELTGQSSRILYPNDEEYEYVGREKYKQIRDHGTGTVETLWKIKNGDIVNILLSSTPLDLNNLSKGVTFTALDITNRKRAEEEKRKALEFAAEQSKHALIGQVAGKMAHDFNNVLMGIMGNAQLAIMDCEDIKTKKKLERINDFSERGRDITNTLLSFSKDQEPKQTYFKIEDKMELALKMLEKELTGIQVSRNYKPGIPRLLADPGMIQDVLVNLVLNSIHAMSKVENPSLALKAYSQDDKIYCEIEDNGCGIPKEHQASIYAPSFTLKGIHDKTGSYKSGIKGTGFGMANVKKYIVEKHKGDIFLESEVGKGTRITIALRIIKNHLSSDEKKEVVKNQIYDKRRILLVEDEAAIADVQYQILTHEPFNHIVSIAANGQIAIDLFDRNQFDIVSLDYMLPGKINGLDVYHHIREMDRDIPVMFISGNIEFLESMKELKEKDPNLEHLSKPVNNFDYVNEINGLIGKRT